MKNAKRIFCVLCFPALTTHAVVQWVGVMYFVFAGGRTYVREELADLHAGAGFHDIPYHSLRAAPGSSLLVAEK